jgi:hypothetical protein
MNPIVPDVVNDVVNDVAQSDPTTTLGAIAVVTLILYLALRELCVASDRRRAEKLANGLLVPITPLLIVFVLVVVWKGLDL